LGGANTFGAYFHFKKNTIMRILAFSLLVASAIGYQFQKKQTSPAEPTGATQASGVLLQSTDGGATWQDLSAGLPADVVTRCVMAQGEEVFLGTEKGTVYHRRPDQPAWAVASVGNPFATAGGMLPEADVIGLYAGQSGAYAHVYEEGFFQKKNGTDQWLPVFANLESKMLHGVVEQPDGTLFVYTRKGIFRSKDAGKNWQHVFAEGWIASLESIGDALVASAPGGLIRSSDGGDTWAYILADEGATYKVRRIGHDFAAVRTAWPWNKEGTDAVVRDIALRASADGGTTWQIIDLEGFKTGEVYDLRQAGAHLFCSHKEGISRSTDGGHTWSLVRPLPKSDQPWRFEMVVSGETILATLVWGGC
jgi:photosystem II stability/assembly factor-like uncharacterized protein